MPYGREQKDRLGSTADGIRVPSDQGQVPPVKLCPGVGGHFATGGRILPASSVRDPVQAAAHSWRHPGITIS